MRRIGTKTFKRSFSGQKFRGCTGIETGLYRYTQQRPIGTGTAHKNAIVPVSIQAVPVPVCLKYPDCFIFSYLSLKSFTVSMGTLLND